jgi:hypothetical protein
MVFNRRRFLKVVGSTLLALNVPTTIFAYRKKPKYYSEHGLGKYIKHKVERKWRISEEYKLEVFYEEGVEEYRSFNVSQDEIRRINEMDINNIMQYSRPKIDYYESSMDDVANINITLPFVVLPFKIYSLTYGAA